MPPNSIFRISFNCQSFDLSTHSPDEPWFTAFRSIVMKMVFHEITDRHRVNGPHVDGVDQIHDRHHTGGLQLRGIASKKPGVESAEYAWN